jgi:hypothetical protein
MKHVDINTFRPSNEWIREARAATAELKNMTPEERRAYLKSSTAARIWGKLRDDLLALNSDKCWYTEAKIGAGDAQVEHFRPKLGNSGSGDQGHDGYWWLAFVFENYRLAASIPNRTKSSDFPISGVRAQGEGDPLDDECPVLLDPTVREDAALVTFVEGGNVVAAAHANHDERERVDYSIRRYSLNTGVVVRERQERWRRCVDAIRSWEMARSGSANSPSRRTRAEVHAKLLAQMAEPSEAYSATARACILLHEGARAVAF